MDNPTNFSNRKRPCSQQLRQQRKSAGFFFLMQWFKKLQHLPVPLKSYSRGCISLYIHFYLIVYAFLVEF